MKKEWLNPQMKNLGLESTKEGLECESGNGQEKLFWPHSHKCKYCGRYFGHNLGSHAMWEYHESICEKNPNFEIADDNIPNNTPVPTFS